MPKLFNLFNSRAYVDKGYEVVAQVCSQTCQDPAHLSEKDT